MKDFEGTEIKAGDTVIQMSTGPGTPEMRRREVLETGERSALLGPCKEASRESTVMRGKNLFVVPTR